ncbi:MAG TPA: WD40 repeat domain-containing protein, partial [Trebonia sp.]|nr:WD40 repeat domain-containing protein [Trebonia sp.]
RDLGVDEGASAGNSAGEGPEADGNRDGSRSAGGGYEPGRLPLLAHALRATWQHRDGNRLTIAGYEAAGGIAGAIARTAEDVYARLDEPGQAAARQIFLSLVRVGAASGDGDAAADTRRRVAADSLLGLAADPVAARAALDAFTAARLLTSGGQAVEITHEALLRRWPRLRGWIDEDRSGLLVRQELEDAAATWAREGKDAAALYGGVRLASAQGWAAASGHLRELTQAGRDFLAASERRRRRGTRRRNGIIAVLAALSLLLAGLSVFALNQRSAAEATSRTAEAGLLAAEGGQAWADFRPDTGLQFAAAADRLDPSSSQVRSTLLTTQAVPITGRLLTNGAPEASNMEGVAYNPAGTLIAGTTHDDKVELWSAATRRLLWSFRFPKIDGTHASATAVAFSQDGKTMVVSQQGGPWLFDVANPAHPVHTGTLPVPPAPGIKTPQVFNMAVSSDGTMVAASITTTTNPAAALEPDAGYVLLWNVATRTTAGVIPEGALANSLAFTPDGRSLVVGRTDGGVDLWDVGRHTKTAVLQGPNPDNATTGAAVSPDGKIIAFNATTGPLKYAVKLWSVAGKRVIVTTPVNGANGLTSVAFSPDGTQFAVGDQTGTVRLWAALGGIFPQLLGNFSGHRGQVNHVAFSPDDGTLASASDDGTIDLWNTRGPILGGAANVTNSLAFSPDGKTLAISTFVPGSLAVALYSMPAGKLTGLLRVSGIAQIAFSPDGKTLAVAPDSPGEPVELWNVATQRMTGQVMTGSTSTITTMAFSPDGTLLAVSGLDDTGVQVWSTPRLTRVAAFSDDQQTNIQGGSGAIGLAFSPDGRLLAAVGSDGTARVFGVPGFSLLDVVKLSDLASSLAFSPDGRELAFGSSDGNVYLYSVPASYASLNGKIVSRGTFAASTKELRSVEFLSNDSLVAGGNDAVVRFWNVPSGSNFTDTTPAQTIATHWGAITVMSYSASLGLLATGTTIGSRVWDTEPARVAAHICQTLKAPVQPDLWKEYLPDIPYTPVCAQQG